MAPANRKKRPARVLFTALLLIVLYFLLFPYPLGRELTARPAWAVTVPEAAPPAPAGKATAVAPFQLGDRFGYVRSDGAVVYSAKALYRVALSETGFVNYTRLGTDWILQDTAGERVLAFSGNGYPFLSPDGARILNVKSDLSGLIELDRNGGVLWSRDFPALMTTASLRGDSLLVGLLNGSLLLLNRQGSPVFETAPAGSRIPVIMGSAVTPDGSLIAAVSGIDPQALTVLRRQGSGYAALARIALSSDFRREIRMSFSPDARYLLLEGEAGPGLFDPVTSTVSWTPLRGTLAGMSFPGAGRYAAFAARDGGRAALVVESPRGMAICREPFAARELSLGTLEGQLLLAWDGKLLRIDVGAL